MFEKYTEGARKTIFYGRDEASRRSARSIGPEHLLLGLLRAEPETIRCLMPGRVHISDDLRLSINAVVPLVSEDSKLNELALSAETKEVLHAACDVSQSMGHHHIGVEHLLLGLFSEEHRYGRSADSTIDTRSLLVEFGFNKKIIAERIRNGISNT